MAKHLASPKGTRDLLPAETTVWAGVEAIARRIFSSYGFGEIRTPIFESTELFVRGVGESTDIVGKEMYTFPDKKGRSLTLRPESTAAVARAVVEHRLFEGASPLKLFYLGPQFRYERPQRGRYRQFSQIGAEIFGDRGPLVDAELLLMLVRFLEALGFSNLRVELNTVGDPQSRGAFGNALRSALEPHASELGEDSLRRLQTNPLRILDTKDENEQKLLPGLPRLEDFLSDESREHFEGVCSELDRFAVDYRVDDRLVRGLDYYTRTVFEIVSPDLGAHNAILGGGRYDGLVELLGGPALPGIGFAIGQDRLVEILPPTTREELAAGPPISLVAIGDVERSLLLELAETLRDAGLAVVAELSDRSMKAALKQANRRNSRLVLLVGEKELDDQTVTIKNFETGKQRTVARADLIDHLLGGSSA